MRIRKDARERYAFDESLFSESGHLSLKNVRDAHVFANVFNENRPESEQISPAELNAAGIVHNVLHLAISDFLKENDPAMFPRVLNDAVGHLGANEVGQTLERFVEQFPTDTASKSNTPTATYLEQETNGVSNRVVTVEELLICWVSNQNPAYHPFKELIHDNDIRSESAYERVVEHFADPGSTEAGTDQVVRLMDLLLEPVKRAPDSLKDQLAFMAGGDWDFRLPPELETMAVIGGDLIVEEGHAMAARSFVPGPPPPPPIPDYSDEPEYEQFSPDVDWMPSVVMVAKNAFVWLDQLSKKHERAITRLDEIPDQELEQLSTWGFTALWLIGIWRRSSASRTLKHRTGNVDAESSAYSLHDYVVADELGGAAALTGLRMACQKYGIRLAADMVPNHTGIESKWVTEHPDWFVQLPYPPYPSYSYTSESLSEDRHIAIQVEDGYYDQSDAAVAFRRADMRTGEERFIYHGNDGTSMPWNDTAQLDFSNPDVREAVIQTILHVARQFPIIRFDAAMVLTRKHFRRLWYPAPGSGGGIPSRAEYGMSRAEFDSRMPAEFWREVVDRVAEEVPNTLLLAEAFWLLEGYFVRTLGMHRVYNSAFMHMLKDEENAKYREVIKNTLSFEPEVLKRYVNFMSNPDEETSIAQFGDGDKFFGVWMLLVTMPGLPMIAHGQVEGFGEKYGMEYRRAYLDEPVRKDLISRFEHEISPLIQKRRLFADVTNFFLFDFVFEDGSTDENVFAYTNGLGDERVLVVYNNRYESTSGRLSSSTRLDGQTASVTLDTALDLDRSKGDVVTFRDVTSGLVYIVKADDFFDRGLLLSLRGYQYHAFTDFKLEADDESGTLTDLADRLAGRGIDDPVNVAIDLRFRPVEALLSKAINSVLNGSEGQPIDPDLWDQIADDLSLERETLQSGVDDLMASISRILTLATVGDRFEWPRSSRYKKALAELEKSVDDSSTAFAVLVAMNCIGVLADVGISANRRITRRVIQQVGLATARSTEEIESLAFAFSQLESTNTESVLSLILDKKTFESAFLINEFAGEVFYNKERFELGMSTAFCLDVLTLADGDAGKSQKEMAQEIALCFDALRELRRSHLKNDFRWDEMITNA